MARSLDLKDLKTLALAALGGALEYYDFIVFVFFASVIGKLFFPPDTPDWLQQLQTFGIFAAGYLARPLGGIVMAHFGDLLGRKRMFTFGIFLMSIPTLLTGLLPTYASIGMAAPLALLFLRLLQGAAIGGEIPGAWVFVAEHVPPKHAGFACGSLTAGLTSGILLGSLIAAAINTFYPAEEVQAFAWRIPFLLGGVFGFLGVYLRSRLEETPVFEEMKRNQTLAAELPIKAVIREHRPAIALSMLLTWMLTAAIVVVILMTPTLLQKQYHIAPATALQANSLATLCLTIGCILFGALTDRLGAGKTFILGSLSLLGSSLWFYLSLGSAPELLFPTYALAGFCVGIVGAVPYVMVRAFPPKVRFSGLSFSYNLAYAVFGGLTPIVVTLMLKTQPMAPALYVAALCLLGLVIGLYLLRADMQVELNSRKPKEPEAI
jgi:MFS family permease